MEGNSWGGRARELGCLEVRCGLLWEVRLMRLY